MASLESKGYLIRQENPKDKRSQLLYATHKAETLKNSKASLETSFYEWLIADVEEEKLAVFVEVLDEIYLKSKQQRHEMFKDVLEKVRGEKDETAR